MSVAQAPTRLSFKSRLVFNDYPPASGDLERFEVEKDPDYEWEEWAD